MENFIFTTEIKKQFSNAKFVTTVPHMVNVTKLFYHLFKKNHKNYSFRGFQRKLLHLINLISKKLSVDPFTCT